ncbi:MAG: polyphosphate kinase 1 [Pedobacter sp.]|nr:MAG: polyphosphate kinase 1 [Pedobacter sp.]
MVKKKIPYLNREMSWLFFNERVLQEAADKDVPLIERIKFLAIFSANLEEFYRVRVASMNRLSDLNEKAKAVIGYNPKKILNEIKKIVVKQEKKFERLFQEIVLQDLAQNKIFILNEKQLNVSRGNFVKQYFISQVLSNLIPIMIDLHKPFPELKDRSLYFFVKLTRFGENVDYKYALVEIPKDISRFLVLPESNDLKFIILIEDIIKYCLDDVFYIFEYDKIEAFSIQLTRDAELIFDKQINEKFIEELSKSLNKRKKGKPMRLLFDTAMPLHMLKVLISKLKLKADSLIPGHQYHRFSDFIQFPNVGRPDLEYPPLVPLNVKGLEKTKSIFSKVVAKDYLINLPYQSFDYIVLFLREAAVDPYVTEIHITLYRLAENSKIIHALNNAARNGKQVFCLLELKARFDEQANIDWTTQLIESGVQVNYGMEDYKVHSKICLVKRVQKNKVQYFANLATGNYNEDSAKIYADYSLLTAHPGITQDLVKLFEALQNKKLSKNFKHLLVSPLENRKKLNNLIEQEIHFAKKGFDAYIIIKVNSLADEKIIQKLYEASQVGVKIQLIVRGICCLIPGLPGVSENIQVISLVDRFLEHARVFIFGNKGHEKMYLSSADLMSRNLDHRVEVGFPILDPQVKKEIRDLINLQLQDNVKARIISAENKNKYVSNKGNSKVRAQLATYYYLKEKHQV